MTFDEFQKLEKGRQQNGFAELMACIGQNIEEIERAIEEYARIFGFFKAIVIGEQYVERCLENPSAFLSALDRMMFLDLSIRRLLEEIREDRTLIEVGVAQDHPARPKGPPDPELERIMGRFR